MLYTSTLYYVAHHLHSINPTAVTVTMTSSYRRVPLDENGATSENLEANVTRSRSERAQDKCIARTSQNTQTESYSSLVRLTCIMYVYSGMGRPSTSCKPVDSLFYHPLEQYGCKSIVATSIRWRHVDVARYDSLSYRLFAANKGFERLLGLGNLLPQGYTKYDCGGSGFLSCLSSSHLAPVGFSHTVGVWDSVYGLANGSAFHSIAGNFLMHSRHTM
jgi:hypothetical protein